MSTMQTFVTPPCLSCNETSTIELTTIQFNRVNSGMLVSNAVPELNDETQRLISSGMHPDCWNDMFGRGFNRNYDYDDEDY